MKQKWGDSEVVMIRMTQGAQDGSRIGIMGTFSFCGAISEVRGAQDLWMLSWTP